MPLAIGIPVAENSLRISWAPCRGSFSSIESISPASAESACSKRPASWSGLGSGFGSSPRPLEIANAETRRVSPVRRQRGQAGVLSVLTTRDRKLNTRWQCAQ